MSGAFTQTDFLKCCNARRDPGCFFDSLAYFAGMHRVVLGYHRLLSKRFPFAVYYRVVDEVVLVFAILECRRNPSWKRDKLSK